MQSEVHNAGAGASRRGRNRAWLAVPTAAVFAALALSGSAGAATATPGGATSYGSVQGTSVTTQGIIMSDGRICDPIRHMGC